MRAIEIERPGPPDVLKLVERPTPEPGPGEILVRVATAGVNRPDVLQRLGGYAPPAGVTDIPGLEKRWRIGDRVCALVPGGGYAEFCVAHETNALPIPSAVSFVVAGSIPETAFTVWTNVFDRGALKAGETLLVHGGTSGIGVTAIGFAKMFGAKVIATAGGPDKAARCRALGADCAVDYRAEDFVGETMRFTGGKGADVILDMVGGDYVARNYAAAAVGGRVVQIAFLNGHKAEIDLRPLMMKRLVHTGSTLRPRSAAEKAEIADALFHKVWPKLAAGAWRPVIDSTFPLAQAAEAHRRMESSAHVGKIVLTI
jgi:NADPH:quinone reductase